MALLTADDVLNKKFQSVKFREGYDQVEVDEFLDEVVATIYALQVENAELKEQLEAAQRRISELQAAPPADDVAVPVPAAEPVPVPEPAAPPAPVATEAPADQEAATSMLALAQRLHDEYVRDGQAEGEKIIEEARDKGRDIVSEAEKHRDSILSELDRERSQLETKISELKVFESDYRKSLSEHLNTLIADLGPVGDSASPAESAE